MCSLLDLYTRLCWAGKGVVVTVRVIVMKEIVVTVRVMVVRVIVVTEMVMIVRVMVIVVTVG